MELPLPAHLVSLPSHRRPSVSPAPATPSDILDISRFAGPNRRPLSGPGLRIFLVNADLWAMPEAERLLVLGLPSRSTFYAWVKAARAQAELILPADVLIRSSAVLGIQKALQILHISEAEGVAWMRGPHQAWLEPAFSTRAATSS
ncbi:MAG: hypothetical protein H7345_19450 [Rubritepida sp.]|nr:hypothetical protein [Rubritepida sp.]